MKLRKLRISDADRMLEWMHDETIIEFLQREKFYNKTKLDCEKFILNSITLDNINLAIVDDEDRYMGTVSLKNISNDNMNAEFAITMHSSAVGKGYSLFAIKEIIRIGFEEKRLNEIYWYVNKENKRAVRFYEKCGYNNILNESEIRRIADMANVEEVEKYNWYSERSNL